MFSIRDEKKLYSGPLTPEELQANENRLCEAIAPMILRDDSKLCWRYITGDTKRSLRSVAGEIVSVNLIYTQTDYSNNVEGFLRQVAAELQNKGVTWTAAWNQTKNFGVVSCKLKHLVTFLRTPVSESNSIVQ
jgi:hypothetical protein